MLISMISQLSTSFWMLNYPTVDNHETVDPGNDVKRYKSECEEVRSYSLRLHNV